MTKILSSAKYDALVAKAANFDKVVESIVAKNEDLKAEDVTPEVIEDAISNDEPAGEGASAERVTELEATIATMTTEALTLTSERDAMIVERDTLKTENAALSKLPGAESVVTIPVAEASAATSDTLVEFANKNKGNTLAIVAEMKKNGLI